ncbi:proline iminopeptidase-family hydrolase [Bauldia litoralis]|uniref:proline iminopeptidase-family hydrolase n=1 Tax=Bauldia litoralis TaxID=665467 RepID=UPI0032642597
MWDERAPDETITVEIDNGFKVKVYQFGSGDEVLLCLNGGPGLPCDYLREPHAWLADRGYRVVAYDQLGCGQSDKPADLSLWNVPRYVQELNQVMRALDLPKVHMLGHSWGTFLAADFALTFPGRIRSLVLADGAGDIPHLVSELDRLRAALGPETVEMMQRHEAEGTLDHPAYKAAVDILNYRHVCRLDDWPAPLRRSLDDWNMDVYGTMQGPNEFTFTGNYKDWSRLSEMHRIDEPTLIMCGMHDELTPACSMRMHHAMPNSIIKVFKNSSHMPFYEEPDSYFETLLGFLDAHRG